VVKPIPLALCRHLDGFGNDVCSKDPSTRKKDHILIPLNLDPKACKLLVRQVWNRKKGEYIAKNPDVTLPTANDLLAVCPVTSSEDVATDNTGSNPKIEKLTLPQMFQRNCVGCHESNREDTPILNFENPSRVDLTGWAAMMYAADEKKRMPPTESSMDDEDREKMKNYLIDILAGNKKWGDEKIEVIPPTKSYLLTLINFRIFINSPRNFYSLK
jgi:mono/diheme cytochrome c family protein